MQLNYLSLVAEIREYSQKMLNDGVKTLTLTDEDIQGNGEWAYERGNYLFNGLTGTIKGV